MADGSYCQCDKWGDAIEDFDKMKEGYYWVKTKHPLERRWSKIYIKYIEQDIIDYYDKVGWNEDKVKIIEKVKGPNCYGE